MHDMVFGNFSISSVPIAWKAVSALEKCVKVLLLTRVKELSCKKICSAPPKRYGIKTGTLNNVLDTHQNRKRWWLVLSVI